MPAFFFLSVLSVRFVVVFRFLRTSRLTLFSNVKRYIITTPAKASLFRVSSLHEVLDMLPIRVLSLAALIVAGVSNAHAQPAERVPSFVNDVEPILTRLGCNQGACHGKSTGQNGFRLS